METRRTTESLFAGLSPEARVEAVRLAARMQEGGDEGADLLAAAREAGVADAHLREAARRLSGSLHPQAPRTTGTDALGTDALTIRPGLALAALLAATQIYPAYFDYHEAYHPLFLPILWLSALLAGLLARRGRWWSGLAVAAFAWSVALGAIHILVAGFSVRVSIHPSELAAMGTALRVLLFAAIGTALAFVLPGVARLGRAFAPTLG